MSAIAILSWLAGAALGTRIKVLALLPVTLVGGVVVAVVAGLLGSSLAAVCAWTAIYMVALQLGYLGGLAARSVMAGEGLPNRQHPLHNRPKLSKSRLIAPF